MVEDELLTVRDVARVLKVSRDTVYVLLYREALKSVKIGSCRRIRRTALNEYLDELSQAGQVA